MDKMLAQYRVIGPCLRLSVSPQTAGKWLEYKQLSSGGWWAVLGWFVIGPKSQQVNCTSVHRHSLHSLLEEGVQPCL